MLSPLHNAVQKKDLPKIRGYIASGSNINLKTNDEYQRTPLYMAILTGDPAVVKLLLDAGADVDAIGGYGVTPLYVAATIPNSIALMRLLLNAGANIDHVAAYGFTALIAAIDDNFTENAVYLIERGANLELVTEDGDTPLSIAIENENTTIIRSLLEHGVSVPSTLNITRLPLAIRNVFRRFARNINDPQPVVHYNTLTNTINNTNNPTELMEYNIPTDGGSRKRGMRRRRTRKGLAKDSQRKKKHDRKSRKY